MEDIKPNRYFCFDYIVDGKRVRPDPIDNHFCGKLPKQAANKIVTIFFKNQIKEYFINEATQKIIFRVDEKMSDNKISMDSTDYERKFIGIYVGYKVKLKEPFEIKVGDKTISYYYTNNVVKINSRDELNDDQKIEYDLLIKD